MSSPNNETSVSRMPLMIDPIEFINMPQTERPHSLVIIDLGKAERFEMEHIPGAQLVTPSEIQAGAPIPGLLPSNDKLSELVSRLGITSDSHVLVYDDEGGGWAGRFIWILDEIGHANYSYLDGGLVAWKAEGGPIESGAQNAAKPNKITVSASQAHTVSIDYLLDTYQNAPYVIWDARSPGEYCAEKLNAKRGGHIPGALNYNWTDAMDNSNGLRLKALEQLKQELAEIGIDGSKPIITHCQTHHRSGLCYLISKLLGFDVKAYAGSWGEWGNREDTPIES